MGEHFKEAKAKTERYFEKVGGVTVDPFDIPESPDEMELYIGWAFDRIRAILESENHTQKFDTTSELVALLDFSAGEVGLNVKFLYDEDDGQWDIILNDRNDYLYLPRIVKYFSKLYRFKPSPKRVYGDIYEEPEQVKIGWSLNNIEMKEDEL